MSCVSLFDDYDCEFNHLFLLEHRRGGICPGSVPVLRCLDPGILGEVPVCATVLLQPGPQVSRSRDPG